MDNNNRPNLRNRIRNNTSSFIPSSRSSVVDRQRLMGSSLHSPVASEIYAELRNRPGISTQTETVELSGVDGELLYSSRLRRSYSMYSSRIDYMNLQTISREVLNSAFYNLFGDDNDERPKFSYTEDEEFLGYEYSHHDILESQYPSTTFKTFSHDESEMLGNICLIKDSEDENSWLDGWGMVALVVPTITAGNILNLKSLDNFSSLYSDSNKLGLEGFNNFFTDIHSLSSDNFKRNLIFFVKFLVKNHNLDIKNYDKYTEILEDLGYSNYSIVTICPFSDWEESSIRDTDLDDHKKYSNAIHKFESKEHAFKVAQTLQNKLINL